MPIRTRRRSITPIHGSLYAAAAGGAFTPASLPGLVAWYDASIYASMTKFGGGTLTNNDRIDTWADQSGHGYTLTGGKGAPLRNINLLGSIRPSLASSGNGLDVRGFVTATSVTQFSSGTMPLPASWFAGRMLR